MHPSIPSKLGIEPMTSPMLDKHPDTEIASQDLQMVFDKTIGLQVMLTELLVNMDLFTLTHLPNIVIVMPRQATGPVLLPQIVIECVFSP